MSKGSVRRPTNEEAYQNNWEAIFGKKKTEDLFGSECLECQQGRYTGTDYRHPAYVFCDVCGHGKERYIVS